MFGTVLQFQMNLSQERRMVIEAPEQEAHACRARVVGRQVLDRNCLLAPDPGTFYHRGIRPIATTPRMRPRRCGQHRPETSHRVMTLVRPPTPSPPTDTTRPEESTRPRPTSIDAEGRRRTAGAGSARLAVPPRPSKSRGRRHAS